MKILAGLIFIVIACSIPASWAKKPDEKDSNITLNSFSIDLKQTVPRTSTFVVTPWRLPGETVCEDHKQDAYTGLKAIGKSNYIAVIKSNPCTPTILNPVGYNYGPIPALNTLTTEKADELFGQPIIHTNQRSYKLLSASNDSYFLDLSFDGTKLKQYRVRGQNLRGEPTWCSIEK